MKTRIFLALLGATTLLAPVTFAQQDEGTTDEYKKTWTGVASLKTIQKKDKTRDLLAVYPVFGGSRGVAQVAGLALKNEAIRDFNAFEKESRGTADDLGLHDGMKYEFEFKPSLVRNRPQLISATTLFYKFMGGAHGGYGTTGYVFGYPRGAERARQLHMSDFFSNGNAAKKRVNNLLMAKLRATKGKEQEASWVLDGEVKAVTNDQMENFVAESNGLRWFFAPYAMGPFSSGEFEIKLTSRELGPTFRAGMLR